jgi:hypothetical protein
MFTMTSGIDGFHVVDMVPPGAFQHQVLSYSDYGPFADESLSREKEMARTLIRCPFGQLSGSFFDGVKTVLMKIPSLLFLICHTVQT